MSGGTRPPMTRAPTAGAKQIEKTDGAAAAAARPDRREPRGCEEGEKIDGAGARLDRREPRYQRCEGGRRGGEGMLTCRLGLYIGWRGRMGLG
eukprot:scaffold20722_cov101-Isochrysis_galbana.AAC.1